MERPLEGIHELEVRERGAHIMEETDVHELEVREPRFARSQEQDSEDEDDPFIDRQPQDIEDAQASEWENSEGSVVEEAEESVAGDGEGSQVDKVRMVIAIDYGTTFTGVAYATPFGSKTKLDEITVVSDWGPQMGNHDKIPSVYSYSPASEADEQQWGLSLAKNAIAMVNTKLELEIHDVPEELDIILRAMDGMKNLHFQHIQAARGAPEFPWKGPEAIVTDYLTKVFDYLRQEVARFARQVRDRLPVDIVITVPTEWSYEAINSTYRALTKAGFNRVNFPNLKDCVLVKEPEAAAIYTARYLKSIDGKDFLKVGECFVLCDAGGGTVDVVSYRVKELEPNLVLQVVGIPTGEKCGSIYIDLAFKNWLRELVGEKNYEKLDPGSQGRKISSHASEGEHMRTLMKDFNGHKRKFRKNGRDIAMDLPGPLKNLSMGTKVVGGEITITKADMESFFDPRIDSIVELIQGHVGQIERLSHRVKNIFLIGGFAESEYLQEEIKHSLRLRKISLRRPDTSWTAVVRGAVICGIEKDKAKRLTKMTSSPKHYGICLSVAYSDTIHLQKDLVFDEHTKVAMAEGQMKWVIKKGDVILSDEPKTWSVVFDTSFTESASKTGRIPIYAYPDDDNIPDRYAIAKNELETVFVLKYNLTNVPLSEFNRIPGERKKEYFYTATFIVELCLNGDTLNAMLYLKTGTSMPRELDGGQVSV